MSPASWRLAAASPLSPSLANSAHQLPENLQKHMGTR